MTIRRACWPILAASSEEGEEKYLMNTDQLMMLDDKLNIYQGLQQLAEWQDIWKKQVKFLDQKIAAISENPNPKEADLQKAAQINDLRRRLELQQVKIPLEIAPAVVNEIGYGKLRQHLVKQFTPLTKEERHLWLYNLLFIMTPDLRRLIDKIARIRAYRSFGQQRNFLLGGASGMGKTTFLDWYTSNCIPAVERERNHVPIIKIDAPEGNSVKELLQRIIVACGANYLERDREGVLMNKISLYFQCCGVEVLIIDEVEHIKSHNVRRRVLEISNRTFHIPIICASCEPHQWVEGDLEIEGRWNDYFRLERYTGKQLERLLAFINLILPFPENSFLGSAPKKRTSATQATENVAQDSNRAEIAFIQEVTKGKLGNIMLLIKEASTDAINQGLARLDKELLKKTWNDIQTRPAKREKLLEVI